MPYIYLILSVFMSASASVFGKIFNRQNETEKNSTVFYNFLLVVSAFVSWGVLFAFDFSFDASVLLYSVLFSLCYTVCYLGFTNALKFGPALLTSLLMNLSLIATTIWGFFFWGAQVTIPVIVGLALVVIAIVLCLYSKDKEEEKTISWKWLFFVFLAFAGNAGCAITQRTQQLQYGGQHGSLLMFVALGLSTIVYLFIYLKSDRTDTPKMLKRSWWSPVLAGVCNVLLNLFLIIIASTDLSPSLIYPVIGVGGLAVVILFSLFVFKEKMYWWQWLGVFIGAVAVVLLSI